MLEGTSKPFEEQFNSWYKKFLTEESSMNKEIKEAKDYKQKKLEQSREEAKATLKNYEAHQITSSLIHPKNFMKLKTI